MQTIQHPKVGAYKMPAWPVRFEGKPPPISPAPLLGQHSEEVLGEWLGLGTDDVEGLRRDGVI